MAIAFVQSKSVGNSGADASGSTITLTSTPTAGNVLVAIASQRNQASSTTNWPSGWTVLATNDFSTVPSYGLSIAAKVSSGSDATLTFSNTTPHAGGAPESTILIELSGFGGALPTANAVNTSNVTNDATPEIPAITPTAAANVALLAVVWRKTAGPNPGPPTLSGYTSAGDSGFASTGNRHRLMAWYQLVASASGSYGGISTSSSGDGTDDSNIIHVALKASGSAPVADFTGTPQTGEAPLLVTFTDTSTGTPTSWSWTFGDGGTSTTQSPTHNYTTAGTYDVTLTATNASGSSSVTHTTFVTVSEVAAPGIWADWAKDGFSSSSSGDANHPLSRMLPEATPISTGDNITDDVLAVSWNRGASQDHITPVAAGGFSILLDNSAGTYNPDNTASPYYGKLLPNVPVWCGAIKTTGALTGSGTVRGFAAGYIREIAPTPRAGTSGQAEIIGDDALGAYSRQTAAIEPSKLRSHLDVRMDILDDIGESVDRESLESEPDMLAFSAVDSTSALSALEDLNRATASRHFVAPADTKEDFYLYTTVNKFHKLASSADEAWNADDFTEVTAYRVTEDTIINSQRVGFTPVGYSPDSTVVWTYETLPVTVLSTSRLVIWAEFEDFVFDAALDTVVTSGAISSTITNFGKTAKIEVWATTSPAVVKTLRVTGSILRRGDAQSTLSEDLTSQGAFGTRAGSEITGDLVGASGLAQGLGDFLIWKFGNPLKRPSVTIVGKSTTTLATIFERDLFDVITLTVDRLNMTARRFEIVGLRGTLVPYRFYTVTYELQETPNQSAVHWFTVDTDTTDSTVPIAPF